MNALNKTLSQNIQEWLMGMLGMRGFIRAMNDKVERRKILKIIELIESGGVDPGEARAMITRANDKGQSLEDLIMEFERPSSLHVDSKTDGHIGRNMAHPAVYAAQPVHPPQQRTSAPRPVHQSAPQAQATPQHQPAPQNQIPADVQKRIVDLEKYISALKNHVNLMEDVTRALVERSVVDATRIHGIESVIMALAGGSGITKEVEEVYNQSTSAFLDKRAHLVKK